MTASPITLTPLGGPKFSIVSGHLLHFFNGAWSVDVEISADSLQQNGMPSGRVSLVFGGVTRSEEHTSELQSPA